MQEVEFRFEKLKVYEKSIGFILEVNKIIETFPKYEMYNLSNQFRRASTSIALNIAEGSSGTSIQFCRYLDIAKGSLCESVVCLTLAKSFNYISDEQNNTLRTTLMEISKMISGLKKKLKEK